MRPDFPTIVACFVLGSGLYRLIVGDDVLAAALFSLACAVHLLFHDRATIIVREHDDRRRNPE